MSRPFISFDAPDGLGIRAQVRVSTFTAPVVKVDPGATGKSAKVVFDHTAMGLRHPVYGWCHVGGAVHAAAVRAAATGEPVEARIETSRLPGRDRKLALPGKTPEPGGLASDADLRALCVMVDGIVGDEILTDPGEDDKWSGLARANVPGHLETAIESGGDIGIGDPNRVVSALETAIESGLGPDVIAHLQAMALIAGADVARVKIPTRSLRPRPNGAGVRAREAVPWDAVNSDGGPNLGSWELSGVLAAHRVARRQFAGKGKTTPGEIEQRAGLLTPVICDLVDRVQIGAYGRGRPDRMARSWRLALDQVQELIDTDHPVPFGKSDTIRAEWSETVVSTAVARFRAAAEFVHGDGCLPAAGSNPTPEPTPDPPTETFTPETALTLASVPASPTPAATPEPEGPLDSDTERLARIAQLLDRANLSAAPDGEFTRLLRKKLKVTRVSEVEPDHLDKLLARYESDPGGFAQWVRREVA